MDIKYPIQELLLQLREVLERLSDTEYAASLDVLSGASIGQHVRHILEFFQELAAGYDGGMVNYDRRSRNLVLETNRCLVMELLSGTALALDRPDKDLLLAALLSPADAEPVVIRTNYFRELLYNIEHLVHHMAILRIGIYEAAHIQLPAHFGVAASTLKFRQICAQ